ncbi:serine protease HTRA2, mitochondrial [Patella vulgata]|uniref:serine protease HTRA2, mitochondrial n=1 Tax=Patella vulgata TaxID=6465 RepID=UPI00217FFFFD|nr:serine protease HTRA2, mitochondrial [Patella vulgata]
MLFRSLFSILPQSKISQNFVNKNFIQQNLRTFHTNQRFSSWTNLKIKKFYVFGATSCVLGGLSYFYNGQQNLANIFNIENLTPSVEAAEKGSTTGVGRRNNSHINFIADVVEGAAPAVVYIEIRGRHPYHGNMATLSNGSGFIVTEDGLIMTNAHVVANKQSVRVRLHNGDTYEGVVTAVDQISDLATIKIKGKNLPTLKFGKSCELRPGEWVVALGCPLTLSNTVTAGIVSSVHRGSRELGLHNKNMDYIQTDAVINFGNSGGPLVNMDGEVIGINTMKVTTGISFAIPSDFASDFLIKAEKYTKKVESKKKGWLGGGGDVGVKKRRYMGITMLTLTPSIAMELKERVRDFPDTQTGVYVYKIIIGSPAYHGGLRPGDVITHINEQEIQTSNDIYTALDTSAKLRVGILRGQQKLKLLINTEDMEE